MADKPNSPRLDAFVARVVVDPANPIDALLLSGFLGASSEPGHTRVYLDATLDQYADVPSDAILHSEPLPAASSPLGGSYIWLKKDAQVLHGKVGTDRQKARFLEGPITAAFAGIAGPAAAPNIPFTPNCPSGHVPCPTDAEVLCPTGQPVLCHPTHLGVGCPTNPQLCHPTAACPTRPPACPVITQMCPHTPACPTASCPTAVCHTPACPTPACPTPACPTHLHTQCPVCPTTVPIHCPTENIHCHTVQELHCPVSGVPCRQPFQQEDPAAQPAYVTQYAVICNQQYTRLEPCYPPLTSAPNCYHPTNQVACHATQVVCHPTQAGCYTHQVACAVTRLCSVECGRPSLALGCPTIGCPIQSVACYSSVACYTPPFKGGGGGPQE